VLDSKHWCQPGTTPAEKTYGEPRAAEFSGQGRRQVLNVPLNSAFGTAKNVLLTELTSYPMRIGIRERLSASIISVTIIVTAIIVGYFSTRTKNLNLTSSQNLLNNEASEIATRATAKLNIDLGHTRVLALSYNAFRDYSPADLRSNLVPVLVKSLEENPEALAYWISLEVREIDPDKKENPERITWLADRLGGTIVTRDEVRNKDGKSESPQYLVIKQTKKETLIDPYWYYPPDQGGRKDSLLEATVGVPVIKDGRVIGLAGIDFTLKSFSPLIDQNGNTFASEVWFISNDGTIVHGPEQSSAGKNIDQLGMFGNRSEEFKTMIREGKSFGGILENPDGADTYVAISPVRIGDSLNPWAVCILTSLDEIHKAARKAFVGSLILGLIGILLLSLMIYFFIHPLLRPIIQTTQVLDSVSQGQIENVKKLEAHDKHELGIMAGSVNRMQDRLKAIAGFASEIGKGNLEVVYPYDTEKDSLGKALEQMQIDLLSLKQETERKDWLKEGISGLNDRIKGDKSLADLCGVIIQYIAKYVNAPVGALYVADTQRGVLRLGAGYSFSKIKDLNQEIHTGEGIVGQCAIEKEKIILTQIPPDYFPVKSATGSAIPSEIIVVPCLFNNQLIAIFELGSLTGFSQTQDEFLDMAAPNVAIAIQSVRSREDMEVLLSKTLEQKEELQAQEEELRVTNQELEKNAQLLEEQSERIEEKNRELEQAAEVIRKKAADLEVASRYKSEFLANMSHELRTPLNSMLILSQSLAENTAARLSPEEVESAQIIFKSGNDLLNLINEILDLSKIEAGKMTVNYDNVQVSSIADNIYSLYKPSAVSKSLEFTVTVQPGCPMTVRTDQQRIEQIIKNLVSNALKFTSRGSVTVSFAQTAENFAFRNPSLKNKPTLSIEVADTGIGIPADKQAAIFEAFQQADGSTSRKFGGTGLGLSISRELAKLLGGEIHLKSETGKGSQFILVIPAGSQTEKKEEPVEKPVSQPVGQPVAQPVPHMPPAFIPEAFISDDRDEISPSDLVILIIEDDPKFAEILVKECHKQHFKCLVAGTGEDGLVLADKYQPSAIVLDIMLPGIDGWGVLENIKRNPRIRHIPVHMMSSLDETMDAYQKGAIGYLQKPVTTDSLGKAFGRIEHFIDRKMKRLMIVEDNANMRTAIRQLLKGEDVEISEVSSAAECKKLLVSEEFDCIVLDLGLPDQSGMELLADIRDMNLSFVPPIVVYTGQELTREQNEELTKYTQSIIIKGVRSEERLLDETTLFLHRIVRDLPQQQQNIIRKIYESEDVFNGKQVLLVDDDMRNIFALGKVFEEKGIRVLKAANGKKALEILETNDEIDAILMDIMMPEMDGYEAMGEIRKNPRFAKTPIIALTAKAMKEDRQKCLDAGASDYISKPVDINKLITLLRVWMKK